jgi:acyl-CoA synthetase (AMP-forming)/AMP-acid ligase II
MIRSTRSVDVDEGTDHDRSPSGRPRPHALGRELITHCRSKLAHYKCPVSVDFVDALPRLPTGKLLKRQLRGRYWPVR